MLFCNPRINKDFFYTSIIEIILHQSLLSQQTSNIEVSVVKEDDPLTEQQTYTDLDSQETGSTTENKTCEKEEKEEENGSKEELADQEVTEGHQDYDEVNPVRTSEDLGDSTVDIPSTAEETRAEEMTDGDNIDEDSGQSACPTEVVRLTSKDMTIVGLLCSYLQVCPYGATTEQVLTHIQRNIQGVSAEELEKILDGLPMLFIGDGLDFYNKTWKFKQFSE